MCGRVSTSDPAVIAKKLHLKYVFDLIKPGSINLPPSSELPLITDDKGEELQYFYWSLIPFWSKEKPKFISFNARLENLRLSTVWKHLVGKRHCVIITDGFYEWKKMDEKGKVKQAYLIRMKNQQFTLMAGLWDTWVDQSTGEMINTCTIITRTSNEFMKDIHERMPCLLDINTAKIWLNKNLPVEERLKVLEPISNDSLDLSKVKKVGDQMEYSALSETHQ